MSLFIVAIIFSISSNIDNIIIGMAYGIKGIRIGWLSNLCICLITSFGTFIAMGMGMFMKNFIPDGIANLFGSVIIIFLGVYYLAESILSILNNFRLNSGLNMDIDDMLGYAESSDSNSSQCIELKETVLVGMSLSLNNIGTGIAASVAGVNMPLTIILTFALGFMFIIAGYFVGNKLFARRFGKIAPVLSGILLIALGIFQILP